MKLRINKLISDAGLGSRREVETLIKEGRVTLNGKKALLTDMVGENDTVLFDGVDLPVKDLLVQDHADKKQIDHQEQSASRVKSKNKGQERAESQRMQAAPKSAALRKTSRNNPVNKMARKRDQDLWQDEDDIKVYPMKQKDKRKPVYSKPVKGRNRFRDDD